MPTTFSSFPVGFGGILPVSLGVPESRHREQREASQRETESEGEAALAELQMRYARGEFTDEEFERRVETESPPDAVSRPRPD